MVWASCSELRSEQWSTKSVRCASAKRGVLCIRNVSIDYMKGKDERTKLKCYEVCILCMEECRF